MKYISVHEKGWTNKWKQELEEVYNERGTYVSKIGNKKKTCMLYCHNTNLAGKVGQKPKLVPSFLESLRDRISNQRSYEKNMNYEPALFHFLEVRCFLLKFEMGRSPDIETIS